MEVFDLFWFEQHYRNGICQTESDGNAVTISEEADGYRVLSEPPAPNMVCEQKFYDGDTLKLKTGGKCLKFGGTPIGIWKTYDQYGDVLEETNYEEGWNVDWEAMLLLLDEHKIDLNQVIGIDRLVEEDDGNDNETDETEDLDEEDLVSPEDDEEDPFEFLKSFAQEEGIDSVDFVPSGRYWVITELLSGGIAKEYAFDGITGKKLWDNYIE